MTAIFKNDEDKKTYKNLQYAIVRDIRSFVYEQAKLLPMENQEFFMNIKNIKVQTSHTNGVSVIFFYAQGDNYGLVFNVNPDIVVLYRVKDNAVIMRIKDDEMVVLNRPLLQNKNFQITGKEPMAVFFNRAIQDWHEIVMRIKDSIPTT